MTYEDYLTIFPEFSNLVDYPINRVNLWIEYSTNFVNQERWRNLSNHGIALLTAHMLFMEKNNKGQVKGIITSKSVDSVSYSQDVNLTTYKDAGFFNGSSYGIQFWQLSQLFGAGPIQF